MTILPFVCLGTGILMGIFVKSRRFTAMADKVSTVSLFFLMMSIGLGIGLDKTVMSNLASIGVQCAFISVCAIVFSVIFTVLCEKTVLPLKRIDDQLQGQHLDLYSADIENESRGNETNEENNAERDGEGEGKKAASLVWIMPVSLIAGLAAGVLTRELMNPSIVDTSFIVFLVILYICVGISQGANREVFRYVKTLGFRILWLPAAILIGSLTGGFAAGAVLRLPLSTSVVAAGGMSFYSITGAFMTSAYGLEIGTYGFLVNVMREFFTILMMPLLIKVSLGSPIAGGAAGNMDTMLAPVTKFVGVRLGLITLITGTILTFIVPFLLPILAALLK